MAFGKGRRNHGQAVVEAACGLTIFLGVSLLLVSAMFDIWAYMTYSEQLRIAAVAGAKAYAQRRVLYNAMLLPKSGQDMQRAHAVANFILDQFHLPHNRLITVTEYDQPGALVTRMDISCTVTVPFMQLLRTPAKISVTAYDATGFGHARVARLTAPIFDNSYTPDQSAPNGQTRIEGNWGTNKEHICFNFPIYTCDQQTLRAIGQPSGAPQSNWDYLSFPNGATFPAGVVPYHPGFNIYGRGWQPGRPETGVAIPPL